MTISRSKLSLSLRTGRSVPVSDINWVILWHFSNTELKLEIQPLLKDTHIATVMSAPRYTLFLKTVRPMN